MAILLNNRSYCYFKLHLLESSLNENIVFNKLNKIKSVELIRSYEDAVKSKETNPLYAKAYFNTAYI